MTDDSIPVTDDEPEEIYRWTARRLQPVVLLYVALVFTGFIALAFFALHSMTGVKALALGAVAYLVPLVPAALARIEYRVTGRGLERRSLSGKKPGAFRDVFRWDQLDRVNPGKRGFKFTKTLDERRPLRRLWKAHLSDAFSGEVHVEAGDRERVMQIVQERI